MFLVFNHFKLAISYSFLCFWSVAFWHFDNGAAGDEFRDFQLSIQFERSRPKGKGKVARFKEEKRILDFVPRPHTCVLGALSKQLENVDSDGIYFVVDLFYTGGYSASYENVTTDGFKNQKGYFRSKKNRYQNY